MKFKKILLYLYIVGEMSSTSAASAILFDEIGAAIRLQQQIRANHARKSEEADAKALADGDDSSSTTDDDSEDDSGATDDDSEEGDEVVVSDSDSDEDDD